ncbi:MAG: restriction endonuclease subunit S, partial [Bacteroidales bacterium]|nr:restriction endonuclease subunit S [Bacteroidales bacterium]
MQLIKYFHELSLHPKNAKELKGLILQLAVQGKLTRDFRAVHPELCTGSHSASVLMQQIEAEKARLIKEKKIKKEIPLAPIQPNEIPKDSPLGWSLVKLGDIGDWGAGATPSRSKSIYYEGNINWFKSGELNNGLIDFDSTEKISELALKEVSLRLNQPGDVLIAMYGATIGKTGLLSVSGTTNQAVCACTCFSCIDNLYMHLLLKALKRAFIEQGEGGAQPNISRVKIRNTVISLPPLPEQKAIVETVNQLFKEVEQLEQLTVERIQLKEQFAISALN